MNKDLKRKVINGFFSIGTLNTRSAPAYKVDLKKRLIDSSNVRVIRVPSLSEGLGECFNEVDSLMLDAEKDLVHG